MPGRCGPAISCVRTREFGIGRHQVQYAVKRPGSVLSMTSHSMTAPVATARCTRPAVRNSRCAALQPGVRTGNRNRPSRFSGAAGGSRHCRSHPCQVWRRGWSAGTATPDPRPPGGVVFPICMPVNGSGFARKSPPGRPVDGYGQLLNPPLPRSSGLRPPVPGMMAALRARAALMAAGGGRKPRCRVQRRTAQYVAPDPGCPAPFSERRRSRRRPRGRTRTRRRRARLRGPRPAR